MPPSTVLIFFLVTVGSRFGRQKTTVRRLIRVVHSRRLRTTFRTVELPPFSTKSYAKLVREYLRDEDHVHGGYVSRE